MNRLLIKVFGGYGIGLNEGFLRESTIQNCHVEQVGADGLDHKSRSSNTSEVDTGNTILNFTASEYGLRVTGSSGIDVRGSWNIQGVNSKLSASSIGTSTGIRLRPVSEANNISNYCNVNNVHVDCTASSDNVGVYVDGVQNNLSNITVLNPVLGIIFAGDCRSCSLNGANIYGHSLYAIEVNTNSEDTILTNVLSFDADVAGGALHHYRIEGLGCVATSVVGDSTANLFSVATAAVASFTRYGSSASYADSIDTYELTAGRVGMVARGVEANIDIAITPKGTGRIRVGEHSAIGAETITGYITIKDSSGVSRKLAVVS